MASHTNTFPDLQGRMVQPSGCFPSDLYSPDGPSWDGTLAQVSVIMQFTAACRGCRPSLYRQLKPWFARLSTIVLQLLHSCRWQRGVPSLRPTATRVVLSSIRSPRDDTVRAFNQAPDSFLLATRRWAQDLASGAFSRRAWKPEPLGHPILSGGEILSRVWRAVVSL